MKIFLIYPSSACPFEFNCVDLNTLQEGWCDSKGTLEDVKTKLQLRQEGAFKRERAIAYSLAQKVSKTSPSFLCFYGIFVFSLYQEFSTFFPFSNGDRRWIQILEQILHCILSRIKSLTSTAGDGVG